MYSLYYRARVEPSLVWYFTAILRSHDHICFDRTIDVPNSIFEFFVPQSGQHEFVSIVEHFIKTGIVTDFKQLPNRIEQGERL